MSAVLEARDRMDARLASLYEQHGATREAAAATVAGSGLNAGELLQAISEMSGVTAESIYTQGGLDGNEIERLGVDPSTTLQILNGYLLKVFWWGYEAGKAP